MSQPKAPEVLIHILGGVGSGRTTFMRRYLYDIFTNTYDPTLLTGPERRLVDIRGMAVIVGLEKPSSMNSYQLESEVRRFVGSADAILLMMAPARSSTMDETENLRFEVLNAAIDSKKSSYDGLVERVVIQKDIEVPWDIDIPHSGEPPVVPEEIGSEEMRKREEEWGLGAKRGYELASRLGVEASVACPRTGEGVREVVEKAVLEVLERRKVKAQEARVMEETLRSAEEISKRSGLSRLKGLFGRKQVD